MYSNLIVGVDGRTGGRDAAALAALLAPESARIALVNVSVIEPISGRGANPDFELAIAAEAKELADTEREATGVTADWIRVSQGSVGSGLEGVAKERQADLIVIGSCAKGPLGRVLTGDDAASVLHHAHRAVALAPKDYASAPRRISTIGLAYDGSPASQVALAHARSLASELGAHLTACNVATPHVYAVGVAAGAGFMEDPEDLKARRQSKLGRLPGADLEVVVGIHTFELEAFSQEVDLLVCGSRHNSAPRRVVLGSTSTYLSHHSHCPLLITPAGEPAVEPSKPAEQSVGAV